VVVRILFDDLTCVNGLQDFLDQDPPERFTLHLSPGMLSETAIGEAFPDLGVVHRVSLVCLPDALGEGGLCESQPAPWRVVKIREDPHTSDWSA
jgi:hypothetical protein